MFPISKLANSIPAYLLPSALATSSSTCHSSPTRRLVSTCISFCCLISSKLCFLSYKGLPPSIIVSDNQYIYWTVDGSSTIFYVNRDRPAELLKYESAADAVAFSASANGQPLSPSVRRCLSSDVSPIPRLEEKTNVSVTLSWDAPTISPSCQNTVGDLAEASYTIRYWETKLGNGSAKVRNLLFYISRFA